MRDDPIGSRVRHSPRPRPFGEQPDVDGSLDGMFVHWNCRLPNVDLSFEHCSRMIASRF